MLFVFWSEGFYAQDVVYNESLRLYYLTKTDFYVSYSEYAEVHKQIQMYSVR